MSPKRETPAEKAARISAQREAAAEPTTTEPSETTRQRPRTSGDPVSTKKVRITLDLAPTLYDSFGEWNRTAARQMDVGRITSADTLRVLLRRLLADDELSAAVLDDLRRQQ